MTRLGLLALILGACGDGSALDPGSGDDPGTGTSTLLVDGDVTAQARVTNARTGTEYDTEFSVRVTLNNVVVDFGTVAVTSASGTTDLVFQPQGDRAGRWTGRAPFYDEVYVLDVINGDNVVEGVRVDGPDIHVFTEPTAGATVDSTMPLAITWRSSDTADSATIDVAELDRLSIEDTGAYDLAPGALKAERDQARTNEIRLDRTNAVVPAGAVAGSQWSVRIRNDIEVVAQPNPAL